MQVIIILIVFILPIWTYPAYAGDEAGTKKAGAVTKRVKESMETEGYKNQACCIKVQEPGTCCHSRGDKDP